MWTLGTVGGPTWSWWSRKGQRSLDLKKGKGLDEEWGRVMGEETEFQAEGTACAKALRYH